jgi:predicted heme/steroid binding protein
MKSVTKQQLALRNGVDREEVWVAFRGKVYDLSNSRLWHSGRHYEHWAGQDLTEEMMEAPHTARVFDKFQPIGLLI